MSFERCRELVREYEEKEVPWEVVEEGGGDGDNTGVLAMILGMEREGAESSAESAGASVAVAVEETWCVVCCNLVLNS